MNPINLKDQVNPTLAFRLVEYMQNQKYILSYLPGEVNVIYLEGCDLTGYPNKDRPDQWNDLSLLLKFVDQKPEIVFAHWATTEPGRAATLTKIAQLRGGVARIELGQQVAWKIGFHKSNYSHPALVQHGKVMVRRDKNMDGFRTGDALDVASGINHHGTAPGYMGDKVARWSEGCMVRRYWGAHLEWIRHVFADPRSRNREYLFPSTVVGADTLAKCIE